MRLGNKRAGWETSLLFFVGGFFLFVFGYDGSAIAGLDSPYDQKRWAQIGLSCLLIGLLIWRWLHTGRPSSKALLLASLLTFFGLALAMALPLANVWLASTWFFCALGLLALFTLARDITPTQHAHTILVVVVLPTGLYAFKTCFASVFALISGTAEMHGDALTMGFINTRFFGQMASGSVPVILGVSLYMHAQQVTNQQLRAAGIVACWATLIWTLTILFVTVAVASLTALAGSLLLAVLFAPNAAKRRWLVTGGASALTAYGLSILLTAGGISDSFDGQTTESLGIRLELWRAAISGFFASPVFGHGAASYSIGSGTTYGHPHNSILYLAYEFGLLGVLVVLTVIWTTIRGIARSVSKAQDTSAPEAHIALGLAAGLLAMSAHSLLSGVHVMPGSQTLFVLLLGLALCRDEPLAIMSPPTRHRRTILAFGVVTLAIIPWMVAIGHGYRSTAQNNIDGFACDNYRWSGPEVWSKWHACQTATPPSHSSPNS